MNILFVGRFFSPELLSTVQKDSYGKIGFSNHNFEMSLLKGLSEQEDLHVRSVSCPGLFSFPHNNRRFYSKSHRFLINGIPAKSCGVCYLAIINRLWKIASLKNSIEKEFRFFSEGKIHIIVDTPNYELISAVNKVRKHNKNRVGSITLIVPDIPALITSLDHYNWIKRKLVARDDEYAMKLAKESDHLVLLTQQMKELFRTPDSFIVMEGLIGNNERKFLEETEPKEEKILYTGTLRKQFGVLNLLEAYKKMSASRPSQLWICGSGDADVKIEEEARKNNRIKYFGLVPSDKAAELQKRATILVNPRTSEGEYTKYSFPSKTIEYLIAGKSIVMNRLPGIPDDYFNYVYTPKDESIESLKEVLQEVVNSSWEERQAKAKAGFDYVCEKKNAKYQVARIIEMIRSNEQGNNHLK